MLLQSAYILFAHVCVLACVCASQAEKNTKKKRKKAKGLQGSVCVPASIMSVTADFLLNITASADALAEQTPSSPAASRGGGVTDESSMLARRSPPSLPLSVSHSRLVSV